MFLLRSSCFAEGSSCFAAKFSPRVPSHHLLYALSLSSVVCRNTQLSELFPSYSSAACTSILLANIIFLTPFSLLGSSHIFACLPVGLACLRQFGHQFEHIYIARRRRRPHVHFDRLYWVLVRTYVCDTHSFGFTFTYDLGLWLFFIHLALLILVRIIEVLTTWLCG